MSKRNVTNRRSFITGGIAGNRAATEVAVAPTRAKNYLETYSKSAMACEFQLMFNLQQYPKAAAAALEAFELIDACEDQLSIYREHSEVSQINARAFEQQLEVSENLFELLQTAIEFYESTNGAFDITATPLSKVWGFHQRDGKVPSDAEIEQARSLVSGKLVKILPGKLIRFVRAGVSINLGGIGKGYTLDSCVQQLIAGGFSDFVFHGGQSSVIARGTCKVPGSEEPAGWNVGISHPLIPAHRLAELRLCNAALGTSGTGRQGFFHRGKRFGHIIDPRTGWPPDHFLSTTVICNAAAKADALATAFFVMTLDEIQEYCDNDSDVASIVVVNDSGTGKPVIETFNLGDMVWKICV